MKNFIKLILTIHLVALSVGGCDETGNKGSESEVYYVSTYPMYCQSDHRIWTDFIDRLDPLHEENETNYTRAKEQLGKFQRMVIVDSISYWDDNWEETLKVLFENEDITSSLDLESEDIVFGPFAGTIDEKTSRYVLVKDSALVKYEDGRLGPYPTVYGQENVEEINVKVTKGCLWRKCEDTGLHCDPTEELGHLYVYDVQETTEDKIERKQKSIPYEKKVIELNFTYSECSDETLAPAQLTTRGCVEAGIESVNTEDSFY